MTFPPHCLCLCVTFNILRKFQDSMAAFHPIRPILTLSVEAGFGPESGPRRHDGCGYFIPSVTYRRTLPVPQPHCAMASERWCYAARAAELTPSKTAPAKL